jgi:hypothetical protein
MFIVEVAESEGRGQTGSRIQPAGIYEPVPGLLDTLFVPKVAGNQGTRCKKPLVISTCQDGCMASPSWAHSRFASGYGPNRQEALLDSSERAHACACQFNIHIAGHCRMRREFLTQQPCGSPAAHAARRIS